MSGYKRKSECTESEWNNYLRRHTISRKKWYNSLSEEEKAEKLATRRKNYDNNKKYLRERAESLRKAKKEQAKEEIRKIIALEDKKIAMERILDKKFENRELHCTKNIKKAKFLIENYDLRKDFEFFMEENDIETPQKNDINDYLMLKHYDFEEYGADKEKIKAILEDIYINKKYEIV